MKLWRFVFDVGMRRQLERHEWRPAGHSGFDEFDVAEFLAQTEDA
jgi:hypothetical protein